MQYNLGVPVRLVVFRPLFKKKVPSPGFRALTSKPAMNLKIVRCGVAQLLIYLSIKDK